MRFIGLLLVVSAGCGAIVEPGHRGLLFDARNGGLKHDVLQPGWHHVGTYSRIDDFDVTYSTRKEQIATTSSEGLALDVRLAVIYRPIISELYELDTEIGPNYYDEVIGPEFRSAARGVLARHGYGDLIRQNEKIEDEIEADVRRRIDGKHMEVSSITLEAISYAPEIADAIRAKLVGEQEAARNKVALENAALQQKLQMEHEAVRARLRAESEILAKKHEHEMAAEQQAVEKIKAETEAETRITHARAEAEELSLLAKAHIAEKQAEKQAITPLTVMMHAYDALGQLGGDGTTILLGDFAHVPNFLFPNMPGFNNPLRVPGSGRAASASADKPSRVRPVSHMPGSGLPGYGEGSLIERYPAKK